MVVVINMSFCAMIFAVVYAGVFIFMVVFDVGTSPVVEMVGLIVTDIVVATTVGMTDHIFAVVFDNVIFDVVIMAVLIRFKFVDIIILSILRTGVMVVVVFLDVIGKFPLIGKVACIANLLNAIAFELVMIDFVDVNAVIVVIF